MSQGKCNLLKPVDNLTGTFFTFSQYAQDLTKQYTQSDYYRCVPSKYMALNMKLSSLTGNDKTKELGEIFQNYFENACTFLRSKYDGKNGNPFWNQEYTRTLLFQTLQKFGLMEVIPDDNSEDSGISEQIQYIGDINIYSYNELEDGMGYNEIYCYVPNDAKCTNYRIDTQLPVSLKDYGTEQNICGYSGTPYNNLSWSVYENSTPKYIDNYTTMKGYNVGQYMLTDEKLVYVPRCLKNDEYQSDDKERKQGETSLDSFDFNTVVLFYDIVRKDDGTDTVIKYNIPLGIYFAGKPQGNPIKMSNEIHKFVSSKTTYEQGTSYGLRVCSRFLFTPNSTEVIENQSVGSTNVSEMAPLFDKMNDTITKFDEFIKSNDKIDETIREHLASFKSNKVNVPYVRQLGTRKYWFVNGKNTGAVAEYEMQDYEDLLARILEECDKRYYNKTYINTNYYNKGTIDNKLSQYYSKTEIDAKLNDLEKRLRVWLTTDSDM